VVGNRIRIVDADFSATAGLQKHTMMKIRIARREPKFLQISLNLLVSAAGLFGALNEVKTQEKKPNIAKE